MQVVIRADASVQIGSGHALPDLGGCVAGTGAVVRLMGTVDLNREG